MATIRSFRDLRVHQGAFAAAMRIFEVSKAWPPTERYELTDQIRRSSRSVCGCIVEAWRKRRYPAAFIAKLNDAETEASETRLWLDFALACGYMSAPDHRRLDDEYDAVIGQLVRMIGQADNWAIEEPGRSSDSRRDPRGSPGTTRDPEHSPSDPPSPHRERETREDSRRESSADRNIPPSSRTTPRRQP